MSELDRKLTRSEQARVNGAKSTGAKTADGIERIRAANRKKGCYALHTVLLPTESREAYDELREECLDYWRPKNIMETQLVDEVIDITWVIGRLTASATHSTRLSMVRFRDESKKPLRGYEIVAAADADGSTLSSTPSLIERRIAALSQRRSRVMQDLYRLRSQAAVGRDSQKSLILNETSENQTPAKLPANPN